MHYRPSVFLPLVWLYPLLAGSLCDPHISPGLVDSGEIGD